MSIAETRQVVFSVQIVTGTWDGMDEAVGQSQERHAAFCVQMLVAEIRYAWLRLLECGPGMVEAIWDATWKRLRDLGIRRSLGLGLWVHLVAGTRGWSNTSAPLRHEVTRETRAPVLIRRTTVNHSVFQGLKYNDTQL